MTWKKPAKDYAAKVLATNSANLLGYWPLDDAIGSTTGRNLKVGANTLATFGAGHTFGVYGLDGPNRNSLSNSGSGAQTTATIASVDGTTATIMAWIRPTVASLTDSTLRYVCKTGPDGNNTIAIVKGSANNAIIVRCVSTGTTVDASYSTDATAGWINVIGTITPSLVTIYINGVKQGSGTARGTAWTGTSTTFYGSSAGNLWAGEMAHLALWTGTNLTDAQIAQLGRIYG